MSRSTLVVVGDTLLDADIEGTSERLCPDAPVPVLDATGQRQRPGGAGLAALLAARAGHSVVLVTALGVDPPARLLADLLASRVEVVRMPLRGATVCKTRIRAGGQSLLRIDSGDGRAAAGPIGSRVHEALRRAGVVLVADYGRGVAANPTVRGALTELAGRVPVVWDPHPKGAVPVPGCRLVTPNEAEAMRFAGAEEGIPATLRDTWGCAALAVTLGARGALLCTPQGCELVPVPGSAAPPGQDTCGAGDAFAAAAAGALLHGAGLREAITAAVDAATRFVAASGWPLLAEPTSGVRCGSHDRGHVVAHYGALLADEGFAHAHGADLVIRIGDTPTSKPLRAWLERARQIVVDPEAAWHDPTKAAETVVAASAVHTCDALTSALADAGATDSPWLAAWLAADARVLPALRAAPDPFEPKAYAALAEVVEDGATVFVSSSMPIRHVETYFPSVSTEIRFLANRGANGIDGVVSSAVGAALGSETRCYLLTGELALLHDLGGLVAARDLGVPLTIVCTNNGGGGIFDFLPVSEHAPAAEYERLIATPRDVDLATVAALAGLPHAVARTPDEVRKAVDEPCLVEFRTDRAQSVKWHRELLSRLGAS